MNKYAEYEPERGASRPLTAADGLLIRHALESDLSDLAQIALERDGGSSEHWNRAFHRYYQESVEGRGVIVVAVLPGGTAGYGKAVHFSPPEDSPANTAPEGWYLSGLIVRPAHRRRGLGAQLTRARLEWIGTRADRAYYFANEHNRASIELHRALGFVELTRDFHHPAARFEGGRGVLFVCDRLGVSRPS